MNKILVPKTFLKIVILLNLFTKVFSKCEILSVQHPERKTIETEVRCKWSNLKEVYNNVLKREGKQTSVYVTDSKIIELYKINFPQILKTVNCSCTNISCVEKDIFDIDIDKDDVKVTNSPILKNNQTITDNINVTFFPILENNQTISDNVNVTDSQTFENDIPENIINGTINTTKLIKTTTELVANNVAVDNIMMNIAGLPTQQKEQTKKSYINTTTTDLPTTTELIETTTTVIENHVPEMLAVDANVTESSTQYVENMILTTEEPYLKELEQKYHTCMKCKELCINTWKMVTVLHLNYVGLRLLKSEFFDGFFDLKVLNLSHNKISNIEEKIFTNLHDLEVLDLSFNFLKEIKEDHFADLRNLERLYLHHNEISKMPSRFFGNYSYVMLEIDLSFNKLKNMQTLFEITVCIRLNNNKIEGKFDFSYVPDGLLEYFDLSHNKIDTIINMNKADIYSVNLSHNNVENISKTGRIQKLDLSFNKLNSINNVEISPYLQFLNLSNNNITDLPSNAFGLNFLENLSLSHNRISVLHSDCFIRLLDLKDLDLSYNDLNSINNVKIAPNLQYLNLSHNNISEILQFAFGPNILEKLSLSHNRISALHSDCFKTLSYLRDLDLSYNMITFDNNNDSYPLEIFSSLLNLTSLDVSENNLRVNWYIFSRPIAVRNLNLAGNHVPFVEPDVLVNDLKYLETVNVDKTLWICEELDKFVLGLRKHNVKVIEGIARYICTEDKNFFFRK